MPKTSFIIVTYNSAGFISRLLESIGDSHKDLSGIKIIIADNDSSDKTLDVIKKSPIKYYLREIPKNMGFAAGINAGAKNANGEYLVFINPDTKFIKGSVWDMVKIFETNKNVGIVGGKLIKEDRTPEKSTGKVFGLLETIIMSLGLDEAFGIRRSPKKVEKVGFVSGGFMMIKKDLFERLSGFDENFFMYIEDMDLCKRASEEGFDTYFTPDAVLVHESHGSSSRSFAIENIYKSLIYYHEKHSGPMVFWLVKIMLKLKALFLVIIGRIINNKYLADSYGKALKI